MRLTAVLAALAVLMCACAVYERRTLDPDDLKIPALDPGIELNLRHKWLPVSTVDFDEPVLFVHGATFPASSTFDVVLSDGQSWMDRMAYGLKMTYALDIRGYGGSTRPPAMSQSPAANPPFARTEEAVRDVEAAVDRVLSMHGGAQRVTLIAWSWGTTVAAACAARHPDKVVNLILVSPVWLGVQPPTYQGAYRTSTYESARAFAIRGIPKDRVEEISPRANFDAWWAATQATDPEGAKQSPPVVRSPNGALQDFAEFWAQGKPTYDPAAIRARTLLIVGEWDEVTPPLMAQGLYTQLVNARERRLVLMSEGTHFMPIEKHHLRLIHEVRNFLWDPSE
jgi:pimeloyl-ACP methyl ester carboxylesterase